MSVRHCWDGLELAGRQGWIRLGAWEGATPGGAGLEAQLVDLGVSQYRRLALEYDASWLVPAAILVMADPMTVISDPNPSTCSSFGPRAAGAEDIPPLAADDLQPDSPGSTDSLDDLEVTGHVSLSMSPEEAAESKNERSPGLPQYVEDRNDRNSSLHSVCKDYQHAADLGPEEACRPEAPDFVSLLLKHGVGLVVRANAGDEQGLAGIGGSYDPAAIIGQGIRHLDSFVKDTNGAIPPPHCHRIVLSFLREVADALAPEARAPPAAASRAPAVAVHCKGGFGRSMLLACLLVIHQYDVPGSALLAWARLVRPGAFTVPDQERFLCRFGCREVLQRAVSHRGRGREGLPCHVGLVGVAPRMCCSVQPLMAAAARNHGLETVGLDPSEVQPLPGSVELPPPETDPKPRAPEDEVGRGGVGDEVQARCVRGCEASCSAPFGSEPCLRLAHAILVAYDCAVNRGERGTDPGSRAASGGMCGARARPAPSEDGAEVRFAVALPCPTDSSAAGLPGLDLGCGGCGLQLGAAGGCTMQLGGCGLLGPAAFGGTDMEYTESVAARRGAVAPAAPPSRRERWGDAGVSRVAEELPPPPPEGFATAVAGGMGLQGHQLQPPPAQQAPAPALLPPWAGGRSGKGKGGGAIGVAEPVFVGFESLDMETGADPGSALAAQAALAAMRNASLSGQPGGLVNVAPERPPGPPVNAKPGDWVCKQCGDLQFARNPSCRRCGATKPMDGHKERADGKPWFAEPGDWVCSGCGDLQFKRNAICRKCQTPRSKRVQAQQAQAQAKATVSDKARNPPAAAAHAPFLSGAPLEHVPDWYINWYPGYSMDVIRHWYSKVMERFGMDPTLPREGQMTKVSIWFSTALRHSPYWKDGFSRHFEKISTFDPYDGWVVVDDLLTNWTENDQWKGYREMHEVLIKCRPHTSYVYWVLLNCCEMIDHHGMQKGRLQMKCVDDSMLLPPRPAICTLSKTLYINGVGEGAAICRKMGNFKIGVQYANEASPRIEEYASNIAEGSGANLPAIWGLGAMEARDTIIVQKPGYQKVIFPSGDYTLKLGRGAKVLKAKKTPSGGDIADSLHMLDWPQGADPQEMHARNRKVMLEWSKLTEVLDELHAEMTWWEGGERSPWSADIVADVDDLLPEPELSFEVDDMDVMFEPVTFDSGLRCSAGSHYDTVLYTFVNPWSEWKIVPEPYSSGTCKHFEEDYERTSGCSIDNNARMECGKVVNLLRFKATRADATLRYCALNTHMSFSGTAEERLRILEAAMDETKAAKCDSVIFVGDFNTRLHCQRGTPWGKHTCG
ncbi:unnamed protein product [Prorocentrum cordatum]|uniref:Protein-tyrosine-phosphatase n=1 Tax=Prorocentrum cordatum TaxID=2364126 RepID=A0ABN9T9Z7_9DINO|nr:unnamed protein product [Polarella glacialis]